MSFGLKTSAVPYSGGNLLFYYELNPKAARFFAEHKIPVASPKTEVASDRIERALNLALTREGLTLRDVKLKLRIKGLYFRPFTRPGVAIPQDLQLSGPARDERYPARQKLTLSFGLPPGSYATIFVKRLMLDRE